LALTLHGTVSDNTVALDRKTATPLIINGDMAIAQRGTSETGITGSTYHTVDRFKTLISSLGTWTLSQSTDVPTGQGFSNSLKWDCTTADASPSASDYLIHQIRMEGQHLQVLKKGTSNAESFTFSFWVKSNKTGTYNVEMLDKDNPRMITKQYTIDSANTWEKKVLSFAGDTTGALDNDNANSLEINMWLGSGSNFSSGTTQTSWATTTNANRAVGNVNLADSTANEWLITGVQLEVGTFDVNSIPPFQFEDVGTSLARCQRYYEKTYNLDVDPGTGSNPVGRYQFYSYGLDDNQRFPIRYHTRKRAAPTIVAYSSADGTSGKASNGGGTNYTVTSDSIGESGFGLKGAGGTQDGFFVHFTFESEL